METATVDTIIFDIGGVLVKEGQRANIYGHYGIPRPWQDHDEWQHYKLGRTNELEYWTRTLAGTPLAGREAEVARYARGIYADATPGEPAALLRPLRDAGYQVGILSNHSTEWSRAYLGRQGIDQLCDPILISAEIGLAKPDPAVYAYTLRAFGREQAPGKCVFIDDKPENIEAARTAGMHAIHYTRETNLEAELRKLGVRPFA
jgi:HAD superfamily hydrolase (TIGR01509 family)